MLTTLIIPGLRSSGPDHWQTWLEGRIAGSVRVHQANWNDASLSAWSDRIRRELLRIDGHAILVAHSFGALAAARAAQDFPDRVAGALFVAPADPDRFGVADDLPQWPLPYPSILVASTNDPWISFDAASRLAGQWGAELRNAGAAGHINAASGFGPWREGLEFVERLRDAALPIPLGHETGRWQRAAHAGAPAGILED